MRNLLLLRVLVWTGVAWTLVAASDITTSVQPNVTAGIQALSELLIAENVSAVGEWSWDAEDDGELQGDEAVAETCDMARLKCAYRMGCGMALQNYLISCSDTISSSAPRCSEPCKYALIALTSTEEGQALMKCKCSDAYCLDSKKRIDVCRPAVLHATRNSTIVSCSVAQWICAADPLCSTALDYYHRFCRSMFHGKKCTHRCNNSISILQRQEKAAKLTTCICDGSEDYDCPAIKANMDRLCFHKTPAVSSTPHSGNGGKSGEGVEVDENQVHPHHRPPHPSPSPPPDAPYDTNEVETEPKRPPNVPYPYPKSAARPLPIDGSARLLCLLFCWTVTQTFVSDLRSTLVR